MTEYTILIVDDVKLNRAILAETFRKDYAILEAANGQEALDILKSSGGSSISAILLDIVMPVMDGFQFLEEFGSLGLGDDIPVFLITADASDDSMRRGYDFGVMDIIEKPIVPYFVKRRVESVIELFRARKTLGDKVRSQGLQLVEKDREILELNNAIIETLSAAIEFRNGESGDHVKRIRHLTGGLLLMLRDENPDRYGFTDEEIINISMAAIMHDVGKIAISDSILNKPGRLTDEEFEIMKTHTVKGSEILELIPQHHDKPIYKYALDICLHHHERWDGRGYPDGLKGDEITIWSQVVSLADVLDALTHERVYKKAIPFDESVDMILDGKCGVFNPELMEILKENRCGISDILFSAEKSL